MDKITVCALYKFVEIKNLKELKNKILSFLKENNIYGTILIANEGINGTVSGDNSKIINLINFLKSDVRFSNIEYKLSFTNKNPFYRTKVKLKKEIVTLGVKIKKTHYNATYINPEEWNEFIKKDDVILIDTRNKYETSIGSFINSVDPKTDSFRDFPNFVKNNSDLPKNKKIAMFCTGGIRCEKSTAYLKSKGFKYVYHLKGGILNYLKKIDKKDSLWKGDCFVFDNRVSVDHNLKKGNYDQCHACRIPITENDKKHIHYVEGVSCANCYNKTSPEKKNRFKERQKQIKIAKKIGINHIGKN
ncbi:MAG: hypothetical protein CMF30_04545 [Kiritimatiellaceae bacterium]|nr:hypothetical protein [Kiritimatiellaceae bacterium]